MKNLLTVLLLVAAAASGALYWLSGNMDGLIKTSMADYGSAMTQARVSVDAVRISLADGKGSISNLQIGNPPGFKTAHAMKVGQIDVEIDIGSVTKDVIVIRRIAIKAPNVIYEKGDAMTNFDAIQKNIADYLGPTDSKKESHGKKLIVEELTIRDAKEQASAAFMNGKTLSASLPDITLKDIGKAKGGVTPGELGQEIVRALKSRLSAALGFDRIMKSTGEALGKAGTAVKGLFK